MKRFIGKLVLLVISFGLIVVAMHAVTIYNLRDNVDEVYTVAPDVEYLFLGSSQVGCAIAERPELHNKVLWVSDTSVTQWYIRLLELERRGQLDHLKAVIVPYNYLIPNQQDERVIRWAFYQELPVSWRYIDEIPFSWFHEALFVMSNLRYPFHMEACSGYPAGRPSIASRPESWKKKHLTAFVRSARNVTMGKGCLKEWEGITHSAYKNIKALCDRHEVDLVVYRQPVLADSWNALPKEVVAYQQNELEALEKCGVRVLYLPSCFSAEYFFDDVHLMEPGTKLFTDSFFYHLHLSDINR